MVPLISSRSKTVKGALVLDRSTSKSSVDDLDPLSFIFQYNPEILTHTFFSSDCEEVARQEKGQRAKGKIVESINLNLELDAIDPLIQPNLHQEIDEYGLHPSLAILESIMLSQNATSSIVLFTWGPNRSIPVSIENMRILEEAFDIKLNPIRAKIELAMRVLDISEFRKGSKGYTLCLLHSDRRNFFIKKRVYGSPFNMSFATKIVPQHSWKDLVIHVNKKEQIRKICNYAKNNPKTSETRGFDKHSQRKGLNILFLGPSESGKTMVAEVIASELKLDLFKIDLSRVVSKYIGETEKNLNRIFKDSEDSDAVLFFDEADALFGKSSEAKDTHDRYDNIEVNYLLHKLDEHQGIVILASRGKVEEAFVKRMNFIVEFPSLNGN